MCNKCVPATPLLALWAEMHDNSSRHYIVRDHIKAQHQQENIQYWSHARQSWAKDTHPDNQERGHKIAVIKATVNKLASREPATLVEVDHISTYIKYLEYINGNTASKVEPAYFNTVTKMRNGEWEMLDIMNKLHPYINNQGSTHEEYARSQAGFVMMNRLHHVHVSTEDINQIAYYPTLQHMRQGREVRTRLGRYLTKYQHIFKLTDSDIKNITEKHSANMRSRGGWSVDFIAHDDEQGWLNVYDSPDVSSCMKGMEAVRVYAHEKSELRLAYVKAGEQYIARCIVRDDPDGEMTGYLRVYPDPNGYAEGRYLLDYLKNNGYANVTNLDGVLLQYITEGGDTVCPYIDYGSGGDQSVSVVYRDGKEYLEAGGGDMSATNTNGYAEDDSSECDECGDRTDSDDLTYIEINGNNVCECCRDNNYTYAYGSRYQDYFPEDECIRVGDEYYWLDTINNHDIYQCDHSGEYYHIDDLVNTTDGLYHSDYVVSIDREDNDGNDYVHMDNVHTLSDGSTCHVDDAEKYQAEIDEQAEPTDVGVAL